MRLYIPLNERKEKNPFAEFANSIPRKRNLFRIAEAQKGRRETLTNGLRRRRRGIYIYKTKQKIQNKNEEE